MTTPAATAPAPKTATRKRTPKVEAPAPEVQAPQETAPAKAETTKVEKPKEKAATDYRREVDGLIIQAAGELVKQQVPEALRAEVAKMIANQLHHLSTPKLGWPSDVLPRPDRSEWR